MNRFTTAVKYEDLPVGFWDGDRATLTQDSVIHAVPAGQDRTFCSLSASSLELVNPTNPGPWPDPSFADEHRCLFCENEVRKLQGT